MSPEELRILSGVIVGVGFFALLHQMAWQVRIGLRDRQTWSAFLFLLSTTVIIGQLALSYLGVVTLGNTERGPVFFFTWLASLLWWSFCTMRHNASVMRRIRDQKKQLRQPLDSVMR